jgi:hypothetical protein
VAGSHKIRSSKKSPTVTTSGWQTTSGHPTSGRLPARLDSGSKSPAAHGSCCGGSILISVGFKFLFWVADLNEFEWCNMLKSQDVGEILQNSPNCWHPDFWSLSYLSFICPSFPNSWWTQQERFLDLLAATPGPTRTVWSVGKRLEPREGLDARSLWSGAAGPGAPPFWGWECRKK